MGQVEKTVFISYRRTNMPWALAIYQNLTAHGYDVFFDYENIASGDFEQVILENVRARAHFLVLLTPSALERCDQPNDWLRREIETALDTKRNMVPLFLEGFDFGNPAISSHLTGKLADLKKYNGQPIPAGFFEDAMRKVREKFLNVSLNQVKHPLSIPAQAAVKKQQLGASYARGVSEATLTAQERFEKSFTANDAEEVIRYTTEAILLQPDFAAAYFVRGIARQRKGDFDGAIQDFSEGIRIKPEQGVTHSQFYFSRGANRRYKGDWDGAMQDLNEAIRLEPNDSTALTVRGGIRVVKGDLVGAIRDFTEAIRLQPDDAIAFVSRGNAWSAKGNPDQAIRDLTEGIRLSPNYADAYWIRGMVWFNKGDYYSAAADYQKYFDLGGTQEEIRQYLSEAKRQIGK